MEWCSTTLNKPGKITDTTWQQTSILVGWGLDRSTCIAIQSGHTHIQHRIILLLLWFDDKTSVHYTYMYIAAIYFLSVCELFSAIDEDLWSITRLLSSTPCTMNVHVHTTHYSVRTTTTCYWVLFYTTANLQCFPQRGSQYPSFTIHTQTGTALCTFLYTWTWLQYSFINFLYYFLHLPMYTYACNNYWQTLLIIHYLPTPPHPLFFSS